MNQTNKYIIDKLKKFRDLIVFLHCEDKNKRDPKTFARDIRMVYTAEQEIELNFFDFAKLEKINNLYYQKYCPWEKSIKLSNQFNLNL